MEIGAADALAYGLAGEFDPGGLDPAGRTVFEAQIGPSAGDRAWVAEIYGMLRVLIWDRRRAG